MDYFDDLNPYLVKEEEMPTRQETPTPPAQPNKLMSKIF